MAKDLDTEKFIKDLNKSVKFVDSANMTISIKKCLDCEPVNIVLERVFKYGKYEYKNVDRTKEIWF